MQSESPRGHPTTASSSQDKVAQWPPEYAAGSLAIVAFGLFDLSKTGNIIISVVAVWIAFLAYKQFQNNILYNS